MTNANVAIFVDMDDCFVCCHDDSGPPWLAVRLGNHATLYFPGYGADNVKAARALAAALSEGADKCEQVVEDASTTERVG